MVNIPTTNGKRPQETSAARARGVARPRCQGRPGECGPAGQSGRGDRPAAPAGDDQGDEGRAEDERRGPQVRRVVDRRVRAERCRVEAARDIPAEEERQHGEVGRQRRELGQEHGAREAGEAEAQQAVDQQVGEVADRQQQRAGVGDEGADEQVGQGLEAQPHGQGMDDRGEDEHGHVEREEGGDRGPEEEEAGVEPAPRAALGRRSQQTSPHDVGSCRHSMIRVRLFLSNGAHCWPSVMTLRRRTAGATDPPMPTHTTSGGRSANVGKTHDVGHILIPIVARKPPVLAGSRAR